MSDDIDIMNDEMNLEGPSDDDRLWSMLAYIFTPLVPIIILVMEDKKDRPFIKAHNMQALVLGIVNVVIAVFFGWLIVPLCLNAALFIYVLYLGFQAYQGQKVTIPVITNFVKSQGWA